MRERQRDRAGPTRRRRKVKEGEMGREWGGGDGVEEWEVWRERRRERWRRR